MTHNIKTMYDSLKTEYNRKEDELKNVDNSLKKLIGSDSFDNKSSIPRKIDSTVRRSGRNYFDDKRYSRSNEMSRKRRLSDSNPKLFSRLDKRLDDDSNRSIKRPSLQSTIVSTQNVVKVKQENVVQDKGADKKSEVRNRRMFGMIMGTLQKFQNEESQRKVVTTKREEIEKKLDQADAEEKEAVKKERLSLIKSKKDKQTQLKDIEVKMDRVEIHQQWEKSNQHLANFIQTKTKPHIFYMPKKQTPETEKRLKETKDKYLIILAERRAKIQKEIDDLNKKEELKKENNDLSFEEIENQKINNNLKNGLNDNKLVNDDFEDGEYIGEEMKISNEKLNEDIKKDNLNDKLISDNKETTIDSEKQDQEELSRSIDEDSNQLNDESNQLNDESNQLNDESNQSNEFKHEHLNYNLGNEIKSQLTTEKRLDDKEFEPIYDE